ncbi:MAG TPA: cobalt-factor II C(20)-methyltransferase [Methanotrichaceae archaeon]|nr:cobalt-factor II C(20)-methyltransferase [Methanotrichaceae archaeon]
MTFKAAEALMSCKKVFVPGEMAAELARPYCNPEILEFPMIEDPEELERIWSKNADLVAAFAADGLAGFATIGDVNTFSTFSHLKRVVASKNPGIEVETIPGVGVVPALAARFGEALDRSFQVSDGSQMDAIIRMKATRPKKMAKELALQGFEEFVLGTRLCTPQEKILRGAAEDMPERSDYFSVLLARRRR